MTRTTRCSRPGPCVAARGLALLLFFFTASAAQASPGDCSDLLAALTPKQAEKYGLALHGCPAAETPAATPPRQAGQLRLYTGEGVAQTAVIVDGPACATPLLPSASPAAVHRPATPPPGSMLRALQLAPDVDAVARRYDIDPLLLHAIAYVESRHDARAVSKAGALGVMQVMPATADRFGVSDAKALHDARTNLEVGASYLKTLQQRFGNDLPLILAAYNSGEAAVERHGRQMPPYAETRRYVKDVMARYETLLAARRQVEGSQAPAS